MFFTATCPGLSLSNGKVSYDRDPTDDGLYPVNTTAIFTCNSGYLQKRFSATSSTCQASDTWSHQTPTCIGNKI